MTTLAELLKKFDRQKYIKNKDYNEQIHGCLVCLEPAVHPVRCKSCKLLACKQCSDRWKKQQNSCPKKCSQGPFQVIPQKPVGIEYFCPYNKSCESIIFGQDYKHHLLNCKYTPEQYKHFKTQTDLKCEYKCQKGHTLQFLGYEQDSDRLMQMIEDDCVNCGADGGVSRSYCADCDVKYCCKCRLPKDLTTRQCPFQHKFFIKEDNLNMTICDICARLTSSQSMESCYFEPYCDFAVCLKCFEAIPKDPDLTSEYEKLELDYYEGLIS